MKNLEWEAIIFVGATLFHDFWIYWGLPHIEYWEAYKSAITDDSDKPNKAV